MTIEEMTGRMSLAERNRWIAVYNREPWGHPREEARFGTLAALIMTASTREFPRAQRTPKTYMYETPREQTDDEMFERMASAFPTTDG